MSAQPDPSRVPAQPFKIHRADVDTTECYYDQASGPSCANDAHYRAPTYEDWMGHSPAVNGPHYCAKCGREGASSLSGSSPEAQLREALEIAVDYMHMWMENNTGEKELRDLERIEAALSGSSQSQPEGKR